jgi:phage terminase large subunit
MSKHTGDSLCVDGKHPVNTSNAGIDPAVISRIEIAAAFRPFFDPHRYKIAYGGRGGAKSWQIARILAIRAAQSSLRVLCAREFQTSIKDSVIALLKGQIRQCGLMPYYRFGQTYIESRAGAEFLFKGLRINPDEIKSLEGVDICWVEEAQRTSEESWTFLIPTIRKNGSEIWCSLNPMYDDDATYKRFIKRPPPDALLVNVNWRDNPWFPQTLNAERLYCLETDPEAYNWIWEGHTRKISDAVIFKGKFAIETFETPDNARFMFGADWGFGPDPTVLIRCFEKDECLYVDQESYALGLDLNKIADTWRKGIPGCDKHNIYADNSQPQTINHVKGFGFRIGPAKKWPGSVEDGITFMRGYRKIIIHERCFYTGQEFHLYSYKTDKSTDEALPVIVDKHNHCIDAIRYALDKRIKRRRGVI